MKLEHLSIHGHRMACRIGGRGPGLLLIHGMAGSSETWNHVADVLAQSFTVIAPDLLGHGESGKPRRSEYTLAAHANLLRDLLDVLGQEQVTLVGQSLGGGVAMQFAYQFPERCERLVLVSAGGLGREVNPILRALTLPGADYVFPLLCTPFLRSAGNLLAGGLRYVGMQATPSVEETWRSYSSLADTDTRRAFFRILHSVVDIGGQAISAHNRMYLTAHLPTLIVWGAQDPIIPVRHGYAANEMMPGSRLVIFDGVGHYPHCENPEGFVEALMEFIATTEPSDLSEAQWRDLLRGDPTRPGRAKVEQRIHAVG